MKLVIDLDEVFKTAFDHMDSEVDIRWPIGMALEELYGEQGINELQDKLIEKFEMEAYGHTI